MDRTDRGPQIGSISLEDRNEALELVFSHLEPADRRRQIRETLAANWSGAMLGTLMGAWHSGRLVGAVLAQLQPGRTAVIWLPRLADDEPESSAAALLTASCECLAGRQVAVAQVLLKQASECDDRILRQGGFDLLANLLYLVSPKETFPTILPTTPLVFEPYREADHGRLARIIEATYEGTFDCPRLQGARDTDDVLAGYRSTGEFDPCRWLIVRHADRDVGCVLCADHPQFDNMELLYMGLIRAARRRRWGRELARHAQWLAGRAGRARLVLAIDRANAPAFQTYIAVGFEAWQQRQLYVRQFHT